MRVGGSLSDAAYHNWSLVASSTVRGAEVLALQQDGSGDGRDHDAGKVGYITGHRCMS